MDGIRYFYTEAGDIELICTRGHARYYPQHMHAKHWTVGMVHAGTMTLTTSQTTCHLQAGQYFLVRPYEPHSLRVGEGSHVLVLCCSNLSSLLLFGYKYCDLLLHSHYIDTCEAKSIAEIIAYCKVHAAMIFYTQVEEKKSIAARSVQAIVDLMLENPAETLALEQVAAHAGYSKWHFLRCFQKAMGIPPCSFHTLCRLRAVRSLLRADTSAVELAVSAGFFDQSHMYKAFKRYHGLTPMQFKQGSFRMEP